MMEGATSEDIRMAEQRSAVIIAAVRSGGTFLSECLSNHPNVHCVRGEPMHKRSLWRLCLADDPRTVLKLALHQAHYEVSMCKLTYGQAFDPVVYRYLVKRQPLVIWLRRENVLRQAVSVILVKLRNKGLDRPVHSTSAVGPVQIMLDPGVLLEHARGLVEGEAKARESLEAFAKRLELTYVQVVGGEDVSATKLSPRVTTEVCRFLGVRREVLRSDLVRVNPQPLREMFVNWGEIERAIAGSEFAGWLEEEIPRCARNDKGERAC